MSVCICAYVNVCGWVMWVWCVLGMGVSTHMYGCEWGKCHCTVCGGAVCMNI